MLADVPIIGGLFQSVIIYAKQTAFIARRPFAFARKTNFTDQQELKRSLNYLCAGIVVCYLIHIPTFVKHDTDMSQGLFLIFQFLRMFLLFLCVHIFLRLLGSKQPVRTTIVTQSYVNGFFVPIGQLFSLPLVLAAGPTLLFGGFETSTNPEIQRNIQIAYSEPIVQFSQAAFFALNLWGLCVVTSWYSQSHKMRKLRVIVASILGVSFGFALHQFVFLPLWGRVHQLLAKILKFM